MSAPPRAVPEARDIVLGGAHPAHEVDDLIDEVRSAADDVDAAIILAERWGHRLPSPGEGETLQLWSTLASMAAVDLTVARVMEPHLDALAILRQAGADPAVHPDGSTWGVYAAEHPQHRLVARRDAYGWVVDGAKAWCSLADRLSHAVVTAYTGSTDRRAFAIDLRDPGVVVEGPDGWVARGLRDVVSLSIRCDKVPAVPIGGDNWYLSRPGFAWGGAGVAACWFGGAVGLMRTLWAAAHRREPDQIALMHLGAVDAHLTAARAVLEDGARRIDNGEAEGVRGAVLAARVRSVVVDAAEDVLMRVGHALGPAPLTGDERHAARVADLQVYLRQHHAERDDTALGRLLLDEGLAP